METVTIRIPNVFLVMPSLPPVSVLEACLPQEGVLGIIGLTGRAWPARVLRLQALVLLFSNHAPVAQAIDESWYAIAFREILPKMLSLLAVMFLGQTVCAIIAPLHHHNSSV